MSKDILLEIGTEEIPARFMPGILTQLEANAKAKLIDMRIGFSDLQVFGTPRRFALLVRGVAGRQEDKESANKGPSINIAFDKSGAPTKAAQGFARGQGIDVNDLVVKDGYVYAMVKETGRNVDDLLPEILPGIVTSLNFPKNMHWGNLDMRFVRPIRWIVALYGNEVIPFAIAGVESSNVTRGHRFLSKGEISIESADEYFGKLAENHVMVDQSVRRKVIREQVEKIAVNQGGIAAIDEDLLEEVVFLVEYPTALCGRFEEEYLALPQEAIITPMREHQRYFPVVSNEGKLLPVFITVRNGGSDYIDIVRQGNERVLKARLADARFFFEEDKKIALADRVDKLKTIVFQEGLGTLYDKTQRINKLAVLIAERLGADQAMVLDTSRAAVLAKADLVTAMVNEFTELQGIMGREYALLSGEKPSVATAVYEHYLPRFAGDALPESLAGRAISIADKIDNIVATFSRGLIPTGSQDPYALRRQALGIVNTIIAAQYNLSLTEIVAEAAKLLGISDSDSDKLLNEIYEFFRLRIKNVLSDEEIRYDVIDAVMAAGIDDLYDTVLRARAVTGVIGSDHIRKAIQAFTRAGNLAKNASSSTINPDLLSQEAERALYQEYINTKQAVSEFLDIKDYSAVLKALSELAEPIDKFFDAVMVMDKDEAIRNNRLALLKSITQTALSVADLSKLVEL
ncbi:MAG: glycine--tRNA ligase subunit beta [Veillonellaceae bacterium]|jgi:glycyl-tRNA synthetase beta chain|nr:glycine--tRNA ligase subunit beta [Veillonellaceae bacterium]